MTHIDTGTYGAKRQSFHSASPRAVLKDAVDKYPRESEAKLFEIVLEQLLERPDCLRAVAEYWFANEFRRLAQPALPSRQTMAPTVQQHVGQIKERLQQHIAREVQIVLSEMLMPSGFKLADSTKEECAKAGGWLATVAAGLADGQRVADVFDESGLQQLYAGKAG